MLCLALLGHRDLKCPCLALSLCTTLWGFVFSPAYGTVLCTSGVFTLVLPLLSCALSCPSGDTVLCTFLLGHRDVLVIGCSLSYCNFIALLAIWECVKYSIVCINIHPCYRAKPTTESSVLQHACHPGNLSTHASSWKLLILHKRFVSIALTPW